MQQEKLKIQAKPPPDDSLARGIPDDYQAKESIGIILAHGDANVKDSPFISLFHFPFLKPACSA